MYKLSRILLKKSQESFLLALELYNKPTIGYRAESFSILFSNAWELLLKAHLLQQNEGKKSAIFRKKQKNRRRESISLDDCLKKVFTNLDDPVKRNVEYISEIRNEAAHLIIQELDPYFSRVFQVGVINYIDQLSDWFIVDLNEQINPGLISLISDKNKIDDIDFLKTKYSKGDFEAISEWIRKFKELEKLGSKATLSIEHRVAIVKNPKNADYIISSGDIAARGLAVVQKIKDPDISHPFNRTKAIAEIIKRLQKNTKFNEHDFEAFVFVKGHKKTNNNAYYYKGKYSGTGQYSQKLIDESVEVVRLKPETLNENRTKYRKHLNRKK